MDRNTRQRSAIRTALEAARRPLSPQEVLDRARGKVPSLGIATVYRALNSLEREGWIIPVQIPGDPTRYEVSGKQHHHHFRCRACGRVFEVQGCPGNIDHLAPDGFVLENHEVLLFGLCAECAKKQAARD